MSSTVSRCLRLEPQAVDDGVPAAALKTFYGWWYSQETTLATACFTIGAAIVSPLLAAVLDSQADVTWWKVAFFIAGAVFAAASGVIWHIRAARVRLRFLDLSRTDVI